MQSMARSLSSAGYRVRAVTDGFRALEIALDSAPPPAALIIDVVMEPIGGADLGRLIRSHAPGIRILFVSAYDVSHLDLNGPFLRKPFRPSQLVESGNYLLGGSAEAKKDHRVGHGEGNDK
ncbi:MAG: response regulator [Gemmatimonadales bacterium]|nr:response regulator [Gemmatimonadales bacterium]